MNPESIIFTAVENAREAIRKTKTSKETFVAFDLGPSGKLLKPYGDFDFEECSSFKYFVGSSL